MRYVKEPFVITPESSQDGFTITELSLAMSLLGVLLLILIISAMGFVNIYNKGITLKRVNQSGANIVKELQTNLSRSHEVTVRRDSGPNHTALGVCTGKYSFIWSVYPGGSGDVNQTPLIALKYNDDGANDTPLYFAKVSDPSKDMCRASPPQPYLGHDPTKPYQSKELLGDGLVVRDPSTLTNVGGLDVIVNPDNQLTTVIFTISTNGGDDIISDGSDRAGCQGGGTDAFCALNTFVVTSYSKGVYN
jgi:prepilin-type N-terminal cleavage/methylation domain-containing protein